jgi:glycosyltransferase 2 family protein
VTATAPPVFDEGSSRPTRPALSFRSLIKPLVTVGLYAVIFYWYVDVGPLVGRLGSAQLGYVGAGVAIYAIGQLLSALRWQVLLKPVELTARYGRLVAFYFIGMFFNTFLPTIVGGDAVKAVLLARETHAPAKAAISVFMERNVGLVALLTIATVAATRAPTVDLYGVPLLVWTVVVFGAFIAANVALTNGRAYHLADRIASRLPLGGIRLRAASLYEAIVPYKRSFSTLAIAILLSFIHQAIVIVVVFLNVRALGFERSVPIPALAVIVPLVSVAGMLPISVNGLGVRDYFYITLFGQLGVPPDAALSLAFLYSAVTLIASLPGGIVYALRRPPSTASPGLRSQSPQ